MTWHEVKWVLLIPLVVLVGVVPWNTLIDLAREEAKKPPKDVL
jgi:hypothetical protein